MYKYGHVQQLAGPVPLQFVGPLGVRGQGPAPVHPALAEPLDEQPVWGHPEQHPPLQVGQEMTQGRGHAGLQGAQRGRAGEGELLGAAGAVDPLVPQRHTALQDEATLWATGGQLQHQLPPVEQRQLHPEVCAHTVVGSYAWYILGNTLRVQR